MDAYNAAPERIRAEADDAILLIESDWPALTIRAGIFRALAREHWTPEVMGVAADSNKPRCRPSRARVLRRSLNRATRPSSSRGYWSIPPLRCTSSSPRC